MDPSTQSQQPQLQPTGLQSPVSVAQSSVAPAAPSSVSTTPPVTAVAPQVSAPQSTSVSGNKEQAPMQADTLQPPVEASQEDKQPAVQEVRIQAQQPIQEVEVKPSVPEITIEKSVEQVVEKSPDTEKPALPQVVKDAGVTLSGPGIPVDENVFQVERLPMTYQQAVIEEKQHPKMNDSKHWLAELIMYIWRKLDPTLGKKGEQK